MAKVSKKAAEAAKVIAQGLPGGQPLQPGQVRINAQRLIQSLSSRLNQVQMAAAQNEAALMTRIDELEAEIAALKAGK